MSRILQTRVPALLPPSDPIRVVLIGEAPGPKGADQSGIPFWGDCSGVLVYRALERAGLAQVPMEAYAHWDGAFFKSNGLYPVLHGAALTNAFPYCPSRDLNTFRAPTDAELRSPDNLARLRDELTRIYARGPGKPRVVTLGKRAHWIIQRLEPGRAWDLHSLPHPSALGLLQAAKGRGKGLHMADLQAEWEASLLRLLTF